MTDGQKLKLNWSQISEDIFGSEENGRIHDMEQARSVLAKLIGKADIENAVLVYMRGSKESELARNLLRLISSPDAMTFCKHIVDSPQTYKPIERQLAVELLRDIGDESILPWIDEFMTDDDPLVQIWAASGVMNLYYRKMVNEEALEKYCAIFGSHKLGQVRRTAAQMKLSLLHEEWRRRRDKFLSAVEESIDAEIEPLRIEYLAICSEVNALSNTLDELLPNDEFPLL